jgi:hypothetical protein
LQRLALTAAGVTVAAAVITLGEYSETHWTPSECERAFCFFEMVVVFDFAAREATRDRAGLGRYEVSWLDAADLGV